MSPPDANAASDDLEREPMSIAEEIAEEVKDGADISEHYESLKKGDNQVAALQQLSMQELVDLARQDSASLVHFGAHLVGDLLQVLAEVELDRGGRGPLDHRRADGLDVGDAGHRVLDGAGDLGFHFRRRCTALRHGNRNSRETYIWILLNWQQPIADHACNGQGCKNNDNRDRVLDRPGRDVKLGHQLALFTGAAW